MPEPEDLNQLQPLIDRYDEARMQNKSCYFDADEFCRLIDYFIELENNNDEDYVDDISYLTELAYKIHPDDKVIKFYEARRLLNNQEFELLDTFLDTFDSDDLLDVLILRAESLFVNPEVVNVEDELLQLISYSNENLPKEESDYYIRQLGLVAFDNGFLKLAIRFLEQAYPIFNKDIELLIALSESYFQLEDYDKALYYINLWIDIDPFDLMGWLNLAKAYIEQQNFQKGIEALEYAKTINHTHPEIYIIQAMCHLLHGHVDEARKSLEEGLEYNPYNVDLYDKLLNHYCVVNDKEKVFELLEKRKHNIGDADDYLLDIRLLIYFEDIEEAKRRLEALTDDKKTSADYYGIDAVIKIQEDRIDEAEVSILKALALDEDNPMYFDRYIMILEHFERYGEAIPYYERLINEHEVSDNLLLRYCFTLLKHNDEALISDFLNQFDDKQLLDLVRKVDEDIELSDDIDRETILMFFEKYRFLYSHLYGTNKPKSPKK